MQARSGSSQDWRTPSPACGPRASFPACPHPVPGLGRSQAWRDHLAGHSQLGGSPARHAGGLLDDGGKGLRGCSRHFDGADIDADGTRRHRPVSRPPGVWLGRAIPPGNDNAGKQQRDGVGGEEPPRFPPKPERKPRNGEFRLPGGSRQLCVESGEDWDRARRAPGGVV